MQMNNLTELILNSMATLLSITEHEVQQTAVSYIFSKSYIINISSILDALLDTKEYN